MKDVKGRLIVQVCMGSSCFSRGNQNNLAFLEAFLKEHQLMEKVHLVGTLCEERCTTGPNLTVDGQRYERVERNAILDILQHHLKEKGLCS